MPAISAARSTRGLCSITATYAKSSVNVSKIVPPGIETKLASNPKQKRGESANVQSRNHQNVKDARFLKGGRFLTIDEAPVAEQHRAKHRGHLRPRGKEQVKSISQSATHSGKKYVRVWASSSCTLNQLRRTQRPDEIDLLRREISSLIECAIIAKNLRPLGLAKNRDFISGM
jgi:hypothetical protein